MKKSKLIFVLAFIIVLISALYACNSAGLTIKFESNGGSTVEDIVLEKGATTFTFPTTEPTREGYEFDYWCLDSALTIEANVANVMATFVDKVTEVTLYAKWTQLSNTYTISFNSNEGSAVASVSVAQDAATFTMPAAPTKTGNEFGGWYLESGLTTAATVQNVLEALSSTTTTITLYAKWTPITYTISFNSNEGSAVADIAVAFDATTFTMPVQNPAKVGNDFAGWYLESGLTTAATVQNVLAAFSPTAKTVTLYAKWAPIVYTISFNSNEGSSVADISVPFGAETFTMPVENPTKADNNFAGWYLESGLTTAATVQNVLAALTPTARTITLYAYWTPAITYNISYNTNGGSEIADSIFPEGTELFVFPTTNPTKVGEVFLNWCLDPELQNVATAQNVLADLNETNEYSRTLYAEWRAEYKFTVVFNTDGGTVLEDAEFSESNMTFEFPTEVEKGDNFFGGWYLSPTFAGEAATAEDVLDVAKLATQDTDITVYLKWIAANYINFAGTLEGIDTLKVRSDADTYELPEYDAGYYYFFDGWYINDTLQTLATNERIKSELDLNEGNITLHANISRAWFVFFDTDGGTEIPALRVHSQAVEVDIVFPDDPTRPDGVFGGWYLDQGKQTEATQKIASSSFVNDEVTIYAKWTLTPEAQAYYDAKADLLDALLVAFDGTRGRGVSEGLTQQEADDLEALKVDFGYEEYTDMSQNEAYSSEYHKFSTMFTMDGYYDIYIEYMNMVAAESQDIVRMDEIFSEISKIKDIDIHYPIPNYYLRLNELRKELDLYYDCEDYITLMAIPEEQRNSEETARIAELEHIIWESEAYWFSPYNYIEFAQYYTTPADDVFSEQGAQDAQSYMELLRKFFENGYYLIEKDDFTSMMTIALSYLYGTYDEVSETGTGDISYEKLLSLADKLNSFDFSLSTVMAPDGYYQPSPQGILDALLAIYDNGSDWSTDDFGILLHRYIKAIFTKDIEESPDMAEELMAQRDAITEELVMELAEVVIGLMQIVQTNNVLGSFGAQMISTGEIATAISSVSATLIEFTTEYSAEDIDNLISTILPLTPVIYLVPEEFSSLLLEMEYHALLSKLGAVLGLVDQDMLDSILIVNEESLVVDEEGAFFMDNLAIIEAKVLCELYGDAAKAAEFSTSYEAMDDDLFLAIINIAIMEFTKNLKGGDEPLNRADPYPNFLLESGITPYIGAQVLRDIIGKEICISAERYNAIKAISEKEYDTAVTAEEIENLIVTKIAYKLFAIMPEMTEIYTAIGMVYEGQHEIAAEDAMGEVSVLSIILALNGVEPEKIQNLKFMIQKGITDGKVDFYYGIETYQKLFIFYSLLTAYDDGTQTEYTPFTAEEFSSLVTYFVGLAADYGIGEDLTPEYIAVLQELTTNDDEYISDVAFLGVKFMELFTANIFGAEADPDAAVRNALTALKTYYEVNALNLPQDAVLAVYDLIKIISADPSIVDESTAANLGELFAILELVIGNENYNSFEEVIDLIIAFATESEALAAAEAEDENAYDNDHQRYYVNHNFIKTVYILFGTAPQTEFADVVALAGEDTPCANLLKLIFDNYATITEWAALDYDYATNNENLQTALGTVIEGIQNELMQIFPFLVRT